ncbi:hypothetical protein [Pseudonocardia xishanensis]|uniref:Uncharacterized protein n=1 Tax=Pseudonocardia xishanensis TaxID=630995 RepID=A0ABP8RYI2_9PSEU
MTVDGRTYGSRSDAGQAVMNRLLLSLNRPGGNTTINGVAELGGLTFDATILRSELKKGYELSIAGVIRARTEGSLRELQDAKPASLAVRMENRLHDLDRVLDDEKSGLTDARHEIERATAQLEQPFPQAEDLAAARRRVTEIEAQLNALAAPAPVEPDPAAPGSGAAPSPEPVEVGAPASSDGELVVHPAATAAAALTPPCPRPRQDGGDHGTGSAPPSPRGEPTLRRGTRPVTTEPPRSGR